MTKINLGSKRFILSYKTQGRVTRGIMAGTQAGQGIWRGDLKQSPQRRAAYWLVAHSLFSQHSYGIQDHLSSGYTTLSELGPCTLTNNQENHLQLPYKPISWRHSCQLRAPPHVSAVCQEDKH